MQTDPSLTMAAEATTCRFCAAISAQKHVWDRPLLQSQNFVVIPSLGSLRTGWLLVVPKDHYISSAVLPDPLRVEMDEIKQTARAALATKIGAVWAFEHGPSRERRMVGCGVDHAHVHLVPLAINLLDAVRPFLPSGVTFQAGNIDDCRNSAGSGRDYLYAERPSGEGMFAVCSTFGSQLFRKAIANVDGRLAEYNWRDFPHHDNVGATISMFASSRLTVGQKESSRVLVGHE